MGNKIEDVVLTRGQQQIADKLGTTQMTISRDLKNSEIRSVHKK